VAAAAHAPGGAQNTNSGTAGDDSATARRGASAAADHKFAAEAATGGRAEVELGRLAAEKGASDEVRQFGRRMVDDHTKADEELTRLASAKGMTLPAAPDPRRSSEAQKLSALAGEKFDREYVRMMIKHHRKSVGDFQKEAERGADPDLKAFAARTLPALREHLRMIQRISDKMALRKSGHLKDANSNTNR
ncbi:MAG TPA: DUF4142 domain-containing protein, partial [Pyrinomonadaceae bacterium]